MGLNQQKSKISAPMLTILWDNDGVLVDTEGLYFRATQTVRDVADEVLRRTD